ncbi:MAG TPA: glycine betaine ABC transporter substrate-binding protein [Methylomirabilota bacterium]|nr:glycine betaine ABC transporter substrate-binding protein [Methylomirabilota bacterium]
MSRSAVVVVIGTLLAVTACAASRSTAPTIRVGSKSFTESYIVAEIVAQIIDDTGEARAERRLGLGGTGIVFTALANGDIDVYPEYTGTIAQTILKEPATTSIGGLRERLQARGLVLSAPLGFDNTYALAVRRDTASRLGVRTISDLARHPELTAAFDAGFLERDDGWPGLRRHYALRLADVRVMEHALTYPALVSGRVDVIDVFSTDGQLARLDLALLRDDRGFFPDYSAVLLGRRALVERFPRTWAALEQRLAGRIDTAAMVRLNAAADVEHRPFADVASTFLGRTAPARPHDRQLARLTLEHLWLVIVSLAVAIVVGLPLGIAAARRPRLAQIELMGVSVLQTIPGLALLAFMIPLFGIGQVPALVALCLYALLPIVRNTVAGLASLDPRLVEMTAVLGVRGWRRLAWIELPLASITIMAGIKTSAVLTVGTATLAAFIGGGGYGTLIVTGLALNDVRTILAGAIPSALMALAIHAAFEALDRVLVPRALRLATASD